MPTWKKGQSGNPKGRPPIIDRAIQSAIEKNRDAVKELTLTLLGMSVDDFEVRASTRGLSVAEASLIRCIERATSDGDIFRLRAVMEIPFGKMPHDAPEFVTTPEERELVLTYRQKLLEAKLE